jgi:exonuclease III
MTYTYRIVTLNINGLASDNRRQMLEHFIRKQEVDVAMLQEVTSRQHIAIQGYKVIDNIGIVSRDTAMLIREELHVDIIKRLPTGRGVAAYYNNICLTNLYAPSGTSNRSERESFSIQR